MHPVMLKRFVLFVVFVLSGAVVGSLAAQHTPGKPVFILAAADAGFCTGARGVSQIFGASDPDDFSTFAALPVQTSRNERTAMTAAAKDSCGVFLFVTRPLFLLFHTLLFYDPA